MAFTGIVCFLFLCLLESRRAMSCTSGDDCWWGESCCKGVCRETCPVCSYDYQCGDGEQCCDGICSSWCATFSPSPTPKTGWNQDDQRLAITLISLFIFSLPFICCICCCCCGCCPYQSHRSSRRQITPQSSTPRQARAYVILSVRSTTVSSVTAHRS